ncbi:lipopolysaccharide biosynthesis protein [Telmatobacter bradus]|uniref:lipopolysaccharide biosynthesis protein n=1 Tax=Telmatobacter bradus TaxID=474953 RepID=UPI003B43628F
MNAIDPANIGTEAIYLQPEPAETAQNEGSRHIGRNVLATILTRVVNMARGVCIVPFLLRHIGLEAYGIWTTVFILVSYVGLTTLGLSNVYIKYTAEFHARREYDRANALLSTGLTLTIPLCSALFAAFVLCWNWYAPLLHLPAAYAAEGKEAILIVLAVFLSSIALSAFGDTLTGMQQIASTQHFLTLSLLVEFVLIVVLVSQGRGVRGLAEAYLARTILNDGLTIWWAWRKLKWMRISPRLMNRESFGYIVHFGGVVQVQTMLDIFLASVERVIGLSLIGGAAAGLMDVAKKWPVAFSAVPMAFFGAMLPAASHVDASNQGEEREQQLRRLYLNCARYSNLCTALFVAAIVFWAAPILRIWLGPELTMRQTLLPLFVVFSLATQMHMMTGPGTSIFRGTGRVYLEFSYSIPNLLLLAVFLPLSRWITGAWTPLGIGIAVALATCGSACVLIAVAHRVLKLTARDFFEAVLLPGLIPYASALLLSWPLTQLVQACGRWTGAAVLLLVGGIYLALSLAMLYRLIFTEAEKQHGQALLHKGMALICRQEKVA